MVDQKKIDKRVFDLYDEYCHGRIDRREFLARSAAITIGGVSALWMAQALLPRYAEAQTISFTDSRIKGTYVEYPSPGGTSGEMRGYLVQPTGEGPFGAVLVIHENRGLNPHIEDVARRAAVAGFLALAPDGLSPVGGYPGNDDDGRVLQRELDPEELDQDMINSARYLQAHALSNGRLGATGFCWGGGMTSTRCGRSTRRRCRRTAWITRCTCSRARCTGSTTTRRPVSTRRRRGSPGIGQSVSSAGT